MTRFQTFTASTLILIAGLANLSPAQAQDGPPCAARDVVVAHLMENYAETRRAMALDTRGIVEIWVNGDTGTFTVTITTPEGVTCLLSAGEHWIDPAPLATGPLA